MEVPTCSACEGRGGSVGGDGGINGECPSCGMTPLAEASDNGDVVQEGGVDGTVIEDCPVCGGVGSIGHVPGLKSPTCTACRGTGRAPAVRDAKGEGGEDAIATADDETEGCDADRLEFTAEELAGMPDNLIMRYYDHFSTRLTILLDDERTRRVWLALREEIFRRMNRADQDEPKSGNTRYPTNLVRVYSKGDDG